MKELINVLEQENKIYESILKISKEKTPVIIEGKVNELENMTKTEQSLVLQIGKLEDARESILGKVSEELKIKAEEITLSEIIDKVGSEEGQGLKMAQENLVKTINDLKKTNDTNSKLIENSLEYINFSINLFSSVDSGTNNYGVSGQVNEGKKKNFFDMKL